MTDVPNPSSTTITPQMDTYDARELIKNGVQACVVLDGQTYYMRITRAGKLILTK
ncbi:hemin uptake protein HemP [Roseobacter denitrificans]|nr:hemin uptake protein HemP [Roseobacter denitrificans]